MSDLATIQAGSYRILAASTTIPSSASAALQVVALSPEIRAMEISNLTAKTLALYDGPEATKKLICYIPGTATFVAQLDRMPISIGSKTRLSIGAADAVDVTAGEVIINFWR